MRFGEWIVFWCDSDVVAAPLTASSCQCIRYTCLLLLNSVGGACEVIMSRFKFTFETCCLLYQMLPCASQHRSSTLLVLRSIAVALRLPTPNSCCMYSSQVVNVLGEKLGPGCMGDKRWKAGESWLVAAISGCMRTRASVRRKNLMWLSY